MMSVTVDHQPLPVDALGLKTVGQVLRHLRRAGDRLVVRVLIDGREAAAAADRVSAIRSALVNEHTVYIETADPRAMAGGVLDEIESQLGEAERIKTESASLLQRNQIAPAIEKLGGAFTTWQHVQESILKTAQLLRLDLSLIHVEGRALTEMLEECKVHLRQVREALDEHDFARLGDLLARRTDGCARWRDVIRSLRSTIASIR